MAILRRNGIPQCLCSWTAPSPYMIVAEEMSYYQCLRTEVPKLFHRNHLQCKSIRARCLLHVRGPVHHRRKYTSSHLRASVQRVRKTQCLKGPPPHVVHYLRKHALPPFCMYQLQGPPESRSEISGGPPRETHGIMISREAFWISSCTIQAICVGIAPQRATSSYQQSEKRSPCRKSLC